MLEYFEKVRACCQWRAASFAIAFPHEILTLSPSTAMGSTQVPGDLCGAEARTRWFGRLFFQDCISAPAFLKLLRALPRVPLDKHSDSCIWPNTDTQTRTCVSQTPRPRPAHIRISNWLWHGHADAETRTSAHLAPHRHPQHRDTLGKFSRTLCTCSRFGPFPLHVRKARVR